MKRRNAICLLLILVLLFSACGETKPAENDSTAPKTEEGTKTKPENEEETDFAKSELVKDADYSTDRYMFPEIVKELPNGATAKINAEIKAIADNLIPKYESVQIDELEIITEYKFNVKHNILSLCIASFDPYKYRINYDSYNINLETGENVSLKDILYMYDFTEEEARNAVFDYLTEHTNYYKNEYIPDEIADTFTPEGHVNAIITKYYDKPLADKSLNFFLNEENFELLVEVYAPELIGETWYETITIIPGKYPNLTLANSADYTQLVAITLNPEHLMIDGAESKNDTFLFTACHDDVSVALHDFVMNDDGTSVTKQVIEHHVLKKGESFMMDYTIPEGKPNMVLIAEKLPVYAEHVFMYDGVYGTPKLEYVHGMDYYYIDGNSSMFGLVSAKVVLEHESERPKDDPNRIWNTISYAVTSVGHNNYSMDEEGYFVLSDVEVNYVASSLFPELKEIPPLEDTDYTDIIQYDGTLYHFPPTYSPTLQPYFLSAIFEEQSLFKNKNISGNPVKNLLLQLSDEGTGAIDYYKVKLNHGDFQIHEPYHYTIGEITHIEESEQ